VGLWDLFTGLFGPKQTNIASDRNPVADRALDASTTSALSSGLGTLGAGERGWASSDDLYRLFSVNGDGWEWDEQATRNAAEFVAECRCGTSQAEGRYYFIKNAT
jgi:hypothetical protein